MLDTIDKSELVGSKVLETKLKQDTKFEIKVYWTDTYNTSEQISNQEMIVSIEKNTPI